MHKNLRYPHTLCIHQTFLLASGLKESCPDMCLSTIVGEIVMVPIPNFWISLLKLVIAA